MNFKKFNGSTWDAIHHKTYDTLTESLERTKNLFDYHSGYSAIYPSAEYMDIRKSSGASYSVIAEVEPNKEYTISYTVNGSSGSRRCRVGMTGTYPQVGDTLIACDDVYGDVGDRKTNTFETPANCHYIIVYFYQASTVVPENVEARMQSMTLVEGTSSSYIPYGFKLQASGEPLTDYTIYGNTGGVGNYVLLPNILKNNFPSQEANGLTITVDGDGFLINGTATANTTVALFSGEVNPPMTVSSYQVIQNGIYEINGNPSDAEAGKYIIAYRYDDAIGGENARLGRVPVGEPGILDNSSGAYRYLLAYIGIWLGATLDNVRFTPTLRRKAYEIPVTSGGVTTNLYIDTPLGLTDALTYTDTGIALPTFDGDNTITFGTTIQPSGMSATFKGWHPVQGAKVYDGAEWR